MRNIYEILERRARLHPDRPAFLRVDGYAIRSLSYGELLLAVQERACRLRDTGIEAGDTVLILETMKASLYISIMAVTVLGARALFVDLTAGTAALEQAVTRLSPKMVMASGRGVLLLLSRQLAPVPIKLLSRVHLKGKSSSDFEPADPAADEPAILTFTSGTGGAPKIIARSHGFLRTQFEVLGKSLGIEEEAIELTCLPMFVLANLAAGATTVLSRADLTAPARARIKTIVREIDASGAGRLLASPCLVDRLAKELLVGKKSLPSLKTIHTGGGLVSTGLVDRVEKALPGCDLVTVYGSSEAEPIGHIASSQVSDRDRLVMERGGGRLAGEPLTEIIIVPQENQELSQDPGRLLLESATGRTDIVTGEILVSGDHVVKGYLDPDAERNTKVRIDGKVWHRTGDTGYLDHRGRLWLTGRLSREGEYTEFSSSLELIALAHPGVSRAAYLGGSDATLYIEVEPGARVPGIVLAGVRIVVVPAIPVDRRHNTKVLYNKISTAGDIRVELRVGLKGGLRTRAG
ncbi:MAG: AMP-binding protein [Candidatus Obscuribacterales bacterium]